MKVKNLSFKYYEKSSNTILDNITFCVPENEISLLIGKSGSGKSTLAYILAGLLPENGGIISNGEVIILENEQQFKLNDFNISKRVEKVSMMFQNPDLQFCMSNLKEELIFTLENINLDKKEIDNRINIATEIVGTTRFLDQDFHTLSGGEKQKCALTCIVALKSKYIILDEPFANIDPKSAQELIKVILKLNQIHKTSFLIIDHIIDRWLETCDNIFSLESNWLIKKVNSNDFEKLFKKEHIKINKTPLLSENIIEIKNLSIKNNDKYIVKNSDLAIKKGSINCLVGESGCGKTTFLKSLYGKNNTNFSGDILIDGIKVCKKNYKNLCKIMGIVLQNPKNQFVSQKVIDEIDFSLNLNKNLDKKSAVEYLKDFNLQVYQNYSPYMLSQGQQRRLAVLSMLCCEQKILLLDEPTYGQDHLSTEKIMKLISTKVLNECLTVFFTTHDLDLANTYADKIFEIKNEEIYEIY